MPAVNAANLTYGELTIPLFSRREKTMFQHLKSLFPPGTVLTSPEELRPYECDGLSAHTAQPKAVVIPSSIDEIQTLLTFCRQHHIPLVVRGAGTGLSGGALPHENGILLSMARFNRILHLDPKRRLARVEPGVRNLAISQAAAPYGLYYAPDPSSQIACTIGGNVAENSGGVHCLKYGLTIHNILALQVLTMEGELLTLGNETLDIPGYDLLALMTGSEGLLGIILDITVKLLPQPETVQVLLAAFDEISHASTAVANLIAVGIIPAGLEMMDQAILQAVEQFIQAGYPTHAAALLLCELDGHAEAVAYQVEQVTAIFTAAGATHLQLATDSAQRQRFWAGRKAAFPAIGRISPDYYCMDGTIPRHQLAPVLTQIQTLAQHYGLRVANVFHAGDGNLHPLILFDANQLGELEKAEALGSQILKLCVEVGGTVTGEHGVGVEKLDPMCIQFNAAELAQFHALKHAFDPTGLLNPGKAIPTLHRCAEFGAMHVHQGQLPFPHLERF